MVSAEFGKEGGKGRQWNQGLYMEGLGILSV